MTMTTEIDLRKLARGRPEQAATRVTPHRSFLSRYAVSIVILVGFMSLLAWATRDRLLPRKPVMVVPVLVTRTESRQEGTVLFRAPGWIEPRPTPVLVTALTEGVVERLLVVEGNQVRSGDPVAQLIDTDARLAVRDSEATLALRAAEVKSVEADLIAARLRVEHPAHLEAALAEADAALAKTETELAKAPFLIVSATAKLDFAKRNLSGKQQAADSISARALQQAESEFASAQAELAELQQRGPRLQREVDTLERRQAALAQQRRLLIDEHRQLAEAEAKLQAAIAKQQQAKLAFERAQLACERTVVRAPIDGRVLQLVARPGTRVTAMEGSAQLGAATIVTLYDPRRLQVRADVRLDDVAQVQPNQPVRIETASVKTPLMGFVLQPTSIANIQKNTLEVKVAIQDPPETVRPEMLVSATFLTPQTAEPNKSSTPPERLLIPKQLVAASAQGDVVWVAGPTGTAELRTVRLGPNADQGLVEVLEGLTPTDKIISGGREGLQLGDRIAITGDDPAGTDRR